MTFSQSALLKKDREARYNARIKRTLDELVPISEKITLLTHASANRVALEGLKTGMHLEEAKGEWVIIPERAAADISPILCWKTPTGA